MNLKSVADPGVDSGDYENPDVLKLGQWTGPGGSTYDPIHSGKPEAPECANVEDTVGVAD